MDLLRLPDVRLAMGSDYCECSPTIHLVSKIDTVERFGPTTQNSHSLDNQRSFDRSPLNLSSLGCQSSVVSYSSHDGNPTSLDRLYSFCQRAICYRVQPNRYLRVPSDRCRLMLSLMAICWSVWLTENCGFDLFLNYINVLRVQCLSKSAVSVGVYLVSLWYQSNFSGTLLMN